MLEYLVLALAFCCYSRGHVLSTESDTIRNLPIPLNTTHTCNKTAEKLQNNTPMVATRNECCHYQHVGQQIIYVNDQQQLKRLFNNNNNFPVKSVGEDYLVSPGIGAHKLHLRKLSWNKARQICVQEGGQLAVINSLSEEKILLRMLQEKNVTVAWLGIHDLYEEGDWVTVKGESLESTGYSGWTMQLKSVQPDNAGGTENCATLIIHGGMNDGNCKLWNVPFFCEISL